jgi:hypothetical protein
MALLAMVVMSGCERPMHVSHKEIVALDYSNRIAVIGDSYTAGGELGGMGANGWPTRAWQMLARQRLAITADVGAEGGAGYGTRGNQGSLFEDLTAATVRPDDALVVFFGSRNDENVDPPPHRSIGDIPGDRTAVADGQPSGGNREGPRRAALSSGCRGCDVRRSDRRRVVRGTPRIDRRRRHTSHRRRARIHGGQDRAPHRGATAHTRMNPPRVRRYRLCS